MFGLDRGNRYRFGLTAAERQEKYYRRKRMNKLRERGGIAYIRWLARQCGFGLKYVRKGVYRVILLS